MLGCFRHGAAQAAKLLGDVTVPSFYPALFASVAGLLEAFGVMVFERIRDRAEDVGEEASPTQQGEAKATEKNCRGVGWGGEEKGLIVFGSRQGCACLGAVFVVVSFRSVPVFRCFSAGRAVCRWVGAPYPHPVNS